MPIYEYACRDCDAGFELRIKYEDRLRAHACPACGRTNTTLRLSAPALALGGRAAPQPTGRFCPGTGQPCACASPLND